MDTSRIVILPVALIMLTVYLKSPEAATMAQRDRILILEITPRDCRLQAIIPRAMMVRSMNTVQDFAAC